MPQQQPQPTITGSTENFEGSFRTRCCLKLSSKKILLCAQQLRGSAAMCESSEEKLERLVRTDLRWKVGVDELLAHTSRDAAKVSSLLPQTKTFS